MTADTTQARVLSAEQRLAAAAAAAPWRLTLVRFLRHRGAVTAGAVLIGIGLLCLAAPLIAAFSGLDPSAIDIADARAAPGPAHPFGTDTLGRDLFIRILYGGRVSLLVGIATALFAAVIGTAIGLAAGYFGGRLDNLLMRFTDSVIALPLLPLLIILAAVDLEKAGLPPALVQSEAISLYRIIVIIALFGWPVVARLVRGAALSLRARDYVRAAAALGAHPARIVWRHILPNVLSPIIVATTLSIGNIILAESVLSFLGLGIQPPTPTWGNMLTDAQGEMYAAPHLAIFPGLAIFITVICFNFLGDGLQDALDPRAQQRRP